MSTPMDDRYDRYDTPLHEFRSTIESNFGDATKYKFSKDIITKLKEIIDLLNDIQEPNGLNYIKGLILKICGATGEYIDLLAQPYTNIYGYEHNKNSGRHGINHIIDKIIAELKSIGATTADGKTDKRAKRLKFLETCKLARFTPISPISNPDDEPIEALFTIMCNYLNGGGDEDPTEFTGYSQYASLIVLTASGGNLVTIFARLLEYLLNKEAGIPQDKNTHFETILNALKNRASKGIFANLNATNILPELASLARGITTDETNLADLITNIANDPLSDIDLKLAPYWNGGDKDHSLLTPNEATQFLLARLKIAKICKKINFNNLQKLKKKGPKVQPPEPDVSPDELKRIRKAFEENYKASCVTLAESIDNKQFNSEEMQDLYPSRMKEQYLTEITQLIANEERAQVQDIEKINNMKKCKIYLLSLSIIKSANDKATGENIDTISSIENLKQFIESNKANSELVSATNNMIAAQVFFEKAQIALTKNPTPRQKDLNNANERKAEQAVAEASDALKLATANFYTKSMEVTIPSTAQFITKIRQIIRCGNLVLKRELSTTTYRYDQIDDCFATSDTLMTSLPVTPYGPGLVIKLMSDILKELITDRDVNTHELLSIINKFTDTTMLAESTMDSVDTVDTVDTTKAHKYGTILSQFGAFIATTMSEHQRNGLKGLILRVDERPLLSTPKDLTIQGYEAYGKEMKETQTDKSKIMIDKSPVFESFKENNKLYIDAVVLQAKKSIELRDMYIAKKKLLKEKTPSIDIDISQLNTAIQKKRQEIDEVRKDGKILKKEVERLRSMLMNDNTAEEDTSIDELLDFSDKELLDYVLPPPPHTPPPPPLTEKMSISGGKKKTYKKKIKTKNYKKSRKANKDKKSRKVRKSRKQRKSRKYTV